MFKVFMRGIMPFDETDFKRPKVSEPLPEHHQEDLQMSGSDMVALYIAAMQVFAPIVFGFAAAYFLAILFMTEVWIK